MSKTAVGIDIGTYQVKVVVAESSNNSFPKIIGVGHSESRGLRHGYVMNQTDAIKSIRKAVDQAEKSSNFKIEKAYISIGGIGLSNYKCDGSIMISRADNEVTELDVEKAQKEAQENIPKNIIQNNRIIHHIPIEYKIDGKPILGKKPVGLKGVKLEVKMMFVMCLEHHVREIFHAIESAGIEITDAVISPIAAGIVTLSKTERIAGCVLANVGSETVTIAVYEDDIPISVDVFPIGSNDITHDIALGLKVSIDEAEKIKKINEIEMPSGFPKKKIQEIINARFSDIFELIDTHLKKINKSGLLPAGIIITGGGSRIVNIEDVAKAILKLPSKVTGPDYGNSKNENKNIKIKDANWSVAYGLCVLGLSTDQNGYIDSGLGKTFLKTILRKIKNAFIKFLP